MEDYPLTYNNQPDITHSLPRVISQARRNCLHATVTALSLLLLSRCTLPYIWFLLFCHLPLRLYCFVGLIIVVIKLSQRSRSSLHTAERCRACGTCSTPAMNFVRRSHLHLSRHWPRRTDTLSVQEQENSARDTSTQGRTTKPGSCGESGQNRLEQGAFHWRKLYLVA